MVYSQRRKLHQAVATWYEQTHAADSTPYYPFLAHHWSRAAEIGNGNGNTDLVKKAIDYLEKAGEQALRNYANREATLYFFKALTLDERLENPNRLRRARWERKLGQAYFSLGELAASRKHLDQALTLLDWSTPDQPTSLPSVLARYFWQQAKPPGFFNGNETTVREAVREAVRAYEQLAHISYFAQEKFTGINAVLCGLKLAEALEASPEVARYYANLSVAAGVVPLHKLAQRYCRRAREVARQLDRPDVLAWVLFITSTYEIGLGRWPEAQQALTESIHIFGDLKDQRNLAESLNLMAMAANFQGDFQSSARLYAEIYETARQRGDPQAQAWGLVGQATNLWRLGQQTEVVSLLREALTLLPPGIDQADETRAYGLLSLAHLRQQKPLLARQTAQVALEKIEISSPTAIRAFEGYASLAELYLKLWENSVGEKPDESDALAKLAGTTCKALLKFGRVFPIGQPRAHLCQGIYEWLLGKPHQAHKSWQKSLGYAQQLEMPYETGLTHYEIGRHLPANDPNRQQHLSQAAGIFARLDAYDLVRVQKESNQQTTVN
jgi:tetratricopeptide (TPR) repeat protein